MIYNQTQVFKDSQIITPNSFKCPTKSKFNAITSASYNQTCVVNTTTLPPTTSLVVNSTNFSLSSCSGSLTVKYTCS